MKKIANILLLVLTCGTLVGCQGQMNKQGSGTLIGGVAGGLLGSQFGGGSGKVAAAAVGAVAGALIGGHIGQSLDEYDKVMLQKTSHQALEFAPSGSSVAWNNPDSGNHGYVTPTKTIKDPNSGRYCREYTQTIVVGGQTEKASGRACRMPDGSWQIEN